MSEPIANRPWKERALGGRFEQRVYLLDTDVAAMLDPRRHAHAPALIDCSTATAQACSCPW